MRWQLLVRYLQAHQIPAQIWVAGEDVLAFNQLQVESRSLSAPTQGNAVLKVEVRETVPVGVASA